MFRFSSLPQQYLCLTLMALQVVQPAHAHAQALKNAPLIVPETPGVTVHDLPNGAQVLNIAPISGGANRISHNVFKKFNVGPNGLIVNNSLIHGPTELSGDAGVAANPNIGFGQMADMIVNEVIGATRSDLLGLTEIKGQKADYVLANPNGITCNGCGFINAPNVTLGAGQAAFDEEGQFLGVRSSDGTVRITGTGADATNTDVFKLVAGKVEIDGPIHAKRLTVHAGTGEAGTGYAIDSTALGGMHANYITLRATGEGVGVRTPPRMAAHSGSLVINAEGHIDLAGDVVAGRVDVNGKTVEQTGTVRTTETQVALVGDEVTVKGEVQAAGRALLAGRTMHVAEGASIKGEAVFVEGSRSNPGDMVTVDGTLHAVKKTEFKNYDSIRIGETGAVSGGSRVKSVRVNNLTIDGRMQAPDIWLNVRENLSIGGELDANVNTELRANTLTLDDTARIKVADNGGHLKLAVNTATLAAGSQVDSGTAFVALVRNTLDTAGTVNTKDLAISADVLVNSGTLKGTQNNTLYAKARFENSGEIIGLNRLKIAGDEAGSRVGTFTNSGTLSSGWKSADGSVRNSEALIEIKTESVSNRGNILSSGILDIDGTGGFTNRGQIKADETVNLKFLGHLQNTGEIRSHKDLNIMANTLTNSDTLYALGDLKAVVRNLTNSGTIFTDGFARLYARNALVNRAGSIRSNGGLHLAANESGSKTEKIENISGTITAEDLTLSSRTLTNSGTLKALHDGKVWVQDRLENSGDIIGSNRLEMAGNTRGSQIEEFENSGTLSAGWVSKDGASHHEGAALSVKAETGTNSGEILSSGTLALEAGPSFDNTRTGQIKSDGVLTATFAGRFTNSGDLISQKSLLLTADAFTNRGLVYSLDDMRATARALVNSGTLLADGMLRLYVRDSLLNQAGLIQGSGEVRLAANESGTKTKKIENRSGQIIAGDKDSPGIPAANLHISAEELLNTKDAFRVAKFTATSSGGTGQGVSRRWTALRNQAQRETRTDYNVHFEYDEVTEDSEASDALATGDIHLNVGQAENSQSVIWADNDLHIDGQDFRNEGRDLLTVKYADTTHWTVKKKRTWYGRFKETWRSSHTTQASETVGTPEHLRGTIGATGDVTANLSGTFENIGMLSRRTRPNVPTTVAPRTAWNAVVEGRDVTVRADRIVNSRGQIIAHRNLSLISEGDHRSARSVVRTVREDTRPSSSGSFVSEDGRLSGSVVRVISKKDAWLRSTQVEGESIAVTALRNLIMETASDVLGEDGLNTATLVQGSMWSRGDIDLTALDGSVVLIGVDIESEDGNVTAQAGGDLVIQSQQQSQGYDVENGPVQDSQHQVTQIRSTIEAGGNVGLQSGEDTEISASTIRADGSVTAQALTGDLHMGSADDVDQAHFSADSGRRSEKRGHTRITPQTTDISGQQGVDIRAGGDITGEAPNLSGGDGALNVHAGGEAHMEAVHSVDARYESEKTDGGTFGISRSDSSASNSRTAQVTQMQGQSIHVQSGGDQSHEGTAFTSDKNPQLTSSNGGIALNTAENTESEERHESYSDPVWQSAKGEGSSSTTHTPVTVANGRQLDMQARDGISIDIPVSADMEHAPLTEHEKLMNAVDILKTRPDMQWLEQALARDDVSAHVIQETTRSWDYEKSGLAPGAAAILAIAVTLATQGAAASFAGQLGATGAMQTALGSGMATLAGQASVSMVNNRGNLGRVLKDLTSKESLVRLASSMATVGLTEAIMPGVGITAQQVKDAGLTGVEALKASVVRVGTQTVVGSLADVAVNGTDLGTAIRRNALASVVNQASSLLYQGIGNISKKDNLDLSEGDLRKVAMHAMVGCGTGEVLDVGCASGAIGAGLQELGSPIIDDLSSDPQMRAELAGMIGSAVVMIGGGDAQAIQFAYQAGKTARTMNRELHAYEKELNRHITQKLVEAGYGDLDSEREFVDGATGTVVQQGPGHLALHPDSPAYQEEMTKLREQNPGRMAIIDRETRAYEARTGVKPYEYTDYQNFWDKTSSLIEIFATAGLATGGRGRGPSYRPPSSLSRNSIPIKRVTASSQSGPASVPGDVVIEAPKPIVDRVNARTNLQNQALQKAQRQIEGRMDGLRPNEDLAKLSKELASRSQMREPGKTIAGTGARVPFRGAQRVATEYGGNAADWVKKSSSSRTIRDGTTFETHWVENLRTGQRVEFKTKFPGE